MTCEFNHCIYNKNFKCIVEEIEINGLGMCDTCITVSLNYEFLEKEKQKVYPKTTQFFTIHYLRRDNLKNKDTPSALPPHPV